MWHLFKHEHECGKTELIVSLITLISVQRRRGSWVPEDKYVTVLFGVVIHQLKCVVYMCIYYFSDQN